MQPSAVPIPSPAETLDQARQLFPGQEAVGALGAGPAGAADVDWFHFHLDAASSVTLATRDQEEGRSLVGVLSLYNTADPYDAADQLGDYYERLGHRLLAQAAGTAAAPDATLQELLGPGDYYVAVSGAGNTYFHPLIAGSGYPGATGDFALLLTTQALNLAPGNPAILAMDPASGAALGSSPFEVRLDLSGDPASYQQVQLVYSPTASFGPDATPVPVTVNFSPLAHEVQLVPGPAGGFPPGAALAPGFYQVVIGTDAAGAPALANPFHYSLTFQVTGSEGAPAGTGDDTPATAHDLGNVTNSGLVQAPGAVGDDYLGDGVPVDVNDVDMYHFQVSGPGQYELTAEVFAGRIGSPLNAALSLFRQGPDGLQLVAANADTTNATVTSDGLSEPLYSDPALFAGLTAGDYYLAVSSGFNVPDPVFGLAPGSGGVFDPNTPNSGQNGDSTGPYVLNLLVQPHTGEPQVESVTRVDGLTTPGGSPTGFVVQFNEPMNLQQLAYEGYQNSLLTGQYQFPGVFVTDVANPGGTPYPLQLTAYNPATNRATFQMQDGLPSGTYQLHLSGADGLTDMAQNPLAGNSDGGDYVYSFTVVDPARDGQTGPLVLYRDQGSNTVQDLGPLFPAELAAQDDTGNAVGVTVRRDFTLYPGPVDPGNTQDVYQFQLLALQEITLTLVDQGSGQLAGVTPVLSTDPAGLQPVSPGSPDSQYPGQYVLAPGIYYIQVGPWQADDPAQVKYDLHIITQGNMEQPTPLTVGPAPAIRLQLVSRVPPPPPVGPPPLPPPGPPSTEPAALPPLVPPSSGPTPPSSPPITVVSLAPPAGPEAPPRSVLLALAFGPLNAAGFSGNGPATGPGVDVLGRVVAEAPRALRSEELVQLASLLQPLIYVGGEEIPPALNPAEGAGASFVFDFPWSQLIGYLFQEWHIPANTSDLPGAAEPLLNEEPEELADPDAEKEPTACNPAGLALAVGGFLGGLRLAGEDDKKRQAVALRSGRPAPPEGPGA